MANSMHKVLFTGTVGADPELQYTQGGNPRMRLRVAVNEWERDSREEKGGHEITTWYNVEVWGKPAETLNNQLAKGDTVAVSGTPRFKLYERKSPDVNGQTVGISTSVRFAEAVIVARRKAQGDFHSAPAEVAETPEVAAVPEDDDEVF